MRFKRFPKYKVGEERIRTKFALIPIGIDNEYRWLETVKIRQRLVEVWDGKLWLNLEFIDE